MNYENLYNLGLEKVAKENDKKNDNRNLGAGLGGAFLGAPGAAAGAAIGAKEDKGRAAGYSALGSIGGGLAGGATGAGLGALASRLSKTNPYIGANVGAGIGTPLGMIGGGVLGAEKSKKKEKTSAADEEQQGKLQRLKQMIANNPGKAGAGVGALAGGLAGGGLGRLGMKSMSQGEKRKLMRSLMNEHNVGRGVVSDAMRIAPSAMGGVGALGGAGFGALAGKGVSKLNQNRKEKTSAAEVEEMYLDGLQKVAAVSGIEPEVLDEAIGMHREEMIKEAEVDALLANISEEEAGEILKEAAAESPELQGVIAEEEENNENEELSELVDVIKNLDDDEAETILKQLED